jgi:DNA modification methylase
LLGINAIYNMDCLQGLKLLDDNSINCCVTSPPYWGLIRKYSGEEWSPVIAGETIGIHDRKHKNVEGEPYLTVNKRSVWVESTSHFSEAHFATYPPKLIEPCILAGCPKDGIVLDPFMGSGTTAMVALQNSRNYIGFELNPDYIKIAEDYRLKDIQIKIV